MVWDRVEQAGDAPSAQAYIAERDIAWVRLVIVVFNVVLYLGFLPHDPARHGLALGICVLATLYAAVVVIGRPYEHLHVLRTSSYTLATDSGLIAFWLYASGGLASPFYALWALSIVAIVFRFGPKVVVVASVVYAVADFAMLTVSGDVSGATAPAIAAREMYILVIGALATLLGHRWRSAVQARVDLSREVKEKEMLVAEAERVRVLTDATFEGICIHDHGRIVEFNQAFARMFGKAREDLLGKEIRGLVHGATADVVRDRVEHPRDTGYELWVEGPSGRMRIAIQSRDILYQGRPCRVAAVRDVTHRYEAEQARALAHDRQMEIERLQEIDRFRTQFINTAAHELNTPLTPIKLQFALLKDVLKERPRSLELMERNMDRLAGLVRDMLDVARLQNGRLKMHPRPVDLIPVLEETVEMFEEASLAEGVHLELLAPTRLIAFADPDRVVQIATNLISNALKFTPRDGHISLVARDIPGAVRLEVVDSGAGMLPEQMERLFQPFAQVHSDPTIPGTGLGLYICRNLTDAMGGDIGVESEGPGKGCRFWIHLPRDDADAGISAVQADLAKTPARS